MWLIKLLKANNWNDLKVIQPSEVKGNIIKINDVDYLKKIITICIKNRNTKYLYFVIDNFEPMIDDIYFKKILKYSLDIEFNLSEEMLLMISKKYKARINKTLTNKIDVVISKIIANKLRNK